MDTNRVIAELRAERDRIERAIAAMEGLKPFLFLRSLSECRAGVEGN